ncbi:hypothetical protein [Jannaschia aquimarina]|uniref:Uncharacterized protein n=1 Tax=Jannaschia aquimarina TaxID=935700 RepID=A0A0D1CNW4_9RHOB|nr:hypothetical protein [Jannaschia aquimarina]KIT16437.1 hypothetical protein jaqu_18240 [Jannaschia aquimarina]SNS92313.1 hypothetical protein SAMN05421775_103324 [Jannaschia aquimarina]
MNGKPLVLTVGVSTAISERLRAEQGREMGFALFEVHDQAGAVAILQQMPVAVIVINVEMRAGSPLAVADYANYRRPQARVLWEMSRSGEFADGSIFAHSANTAGAITLRMQAEDVHAVVSHHVRAAA